MHPVNFKGANKVLTAPEGAEPYDYRKLPIFTDGEYCVSLWYINEEELKTIIANRGIAIAIRSGQTQHPLMVHASDAKVLEDYIQPDPTAEPNTDKQHCSLPPVTQEELDNIVPMVRPKDIVIGEGPNEDPPLVSGT